MIASVHRRSEGRRAGGLALGLAMLAFAFGAPSAQAVPGHFRASAAAPSQGPEGGSAAWAWAWGLDSNGQLGNGAPPGTNSDSSIPVVSSLPAGTTVTAVAAGFNHSLALTSTGQVLAWGANANGELGNGTTTDSNTPVLVNLPAGTTVVAIAAGWYHSLALTATGQVLAWGDNQYGELGNGTTSTNTCTCVVAPAAVSLPAGTTVSAVTSRGYHSLALTSAGQVLAWGQNYRGQLGTGSPTTTGCLCSATPVAAVLPAGTTVTAVATGASFSMVLTSTGQVLAWGRNDKGELGNGTTDSNPCLCNPAPAPVSLPSGVTVTALTGGFYHALALTSTGQVLAWGMNSEGELGNGTSNTTGCSCNPTPGSVLLPSGTTVASIGAGYYHSLAVSSGGQVLAWGLNVSGQLGDGSRITRLTPIVVSGFTAIGGSQDITGGQQHTLAVAPPPPLVMTTAASSPSRSITDTASLSGGSMNPPAGGTITFTLYGPNDATCSNAVLISTKPVNGNGSYTSDSYASIVPGTYRWRASYSGDANNPAVALSTCGDPTETVDVAKYWAQQSPATSPSPRSGASAAYDAATRTVVLLGGGNATTGFNETWTWDGSTWTQQFPATTPNDGSAGAPMAYDAATGTVVLFGADSNGDLSHTWTWDGTTWKEQFSKTSPPNRSAYSLAYDAATKTVVLFGGTGTRRDIGLGTTWTWNGTTWREWHVKGPSTRYLGSMAYDQATGTVVLFGGYATGVGTLNDTWTWNGVAWTQRFPATSPPARYYAQMAYDAASSTAVLFGGSGYPGGALNDTWTWDGTTWTQQSSANSPPVRFSFAMAYDNATSTVVLFGGYGGTWLGDTWTW